MPCVASAQGQSPVTGGVNLSYSYENAIQVNGRAERKVTPDEIYVRIVIDEKEMKVKKTVEQMERSMIAALKKQGVDTDKNLKIDQMSSGFKNVSFKGNQARTRAVYELKVGSAQQLGVAYQAMEDEGISNLSIVRQTHSKLREIQRELRVEAVGDARQSAQDLVGALGQKLGPAVYIQDYGAGGGVVYKSAMTRGAAYDESVSNAGVYQVTSLELSDMELSYQVSVKFALEK